MLVDWDMRITSWKVNYSTTAADRVGVRNATSEFLKEVTDTASSLYDSANSTLSSTISTASDLGSSLSQTLSGGLADTASGIQDAGEGFAKGSRDWWDAVKSQWNREKPSPTDQTSRQSEGPREERWRPGEGPGEPTPPPPTGEAVLGLVGAAVMANSDEPKRDENQLLQLTRKLIEIRSVLLSVDQSDALKLPSIVVIGSQSSGKSSVLEAIVGHEFLPKCVSSLLMLVL